MHSAVSHTDANSTVFALRRRRDVSCRAFSQLVKKKNTALGSTQSIAKTAQFTVGGAGGRGGLTVADEQLRLTETYLLHVTQTPVPYLCDSLSLFLLSLLTSPT